MTKKLAVCLRVDFGAHEWLYVQQRFGIRCAAKQFCGLSIMPPCVLQARQRTKFDDP